MCQGTFFFVYAEKKGKPETGVVPYNSGFILMSELFIRTI